MNSNPLSIVALSGGFDRVHHALATASAAAAVNRKVTMLFTGRALRALIEEREPGVRGWHDLEPADDGSPPSARDRHFGAVGVATFEELLGACVALGVRFFACEMGVRALGLPEIKWRPDVPVEAAGIVTFLAEAEGGPILHI